MICYYLQGNTNRTFIVEIDSLTLVYCQYKIYPDSYFAFRDLAKFVFYDRSKKTISECLAMNTDGNFSCRNSDFV